MHAKWQRLASGDSARMDMFEHISLMTLDSLQKCVFSFNSNYQEFPLLPHARWPATWCTASMASNLVHSFTDAIIQDRCLALASQGVDEFLKAKTKTKMLDFIDLLLLAKDEAGKELSDEDIQAEADTFMFGGHDTKASRLSWILYNLAKHPEYQERCRQEVWELLRGRESEKIEWEHVRHQHLWDSSQPVYDPFRFNPANPHKSSPLAFIPFSAGPRNYMGQTFAKSEIFEGGAGADAAAALPRPGRRHRAAQAAGADPARGGRAVAAGGAAERAGAVIDGCWLRPLSRP